MVLLNDVVEIAATANSNRLPPRIDFGQQPQRPMARGIPIEIHPAWETKTLRIAGFSAFPRRHEMP
jgi:hypothetical protein